MKEDQQQNCYMCRFCKQSFASGKKLGDHMRGHLGLISICRKKGDQEAINGGKGFDLHDDDDRIIKNIGGINQVHETDGGKQSIQENNVHGEKGFGFGFDDVMMKKSDEDEDYSGGNAYVLRQNPKRSWRVSCSSSVKDYDESRTEWKKKKKSVCEECGKVFDSAKGLYGHMRCHSMKRSWPLDESCSLLSSVEHDGGVANPVRKKRSCTRYKSFKHDHHHISSCLSYDDGDDGVLKGALCLMMLSRGVRSLDGLND